MGRHWALRRAGRVVPPLPMPLTDLFCWVNGLDHYAAFWTWNGMAGDIKGSLYLGAWNGFMWQENVFVHNFKLSEGAWDTGVVADHFGDSFRIRAVVPGFGEVVSPTYIDE